MYRRNPILSADGYKPSHFAMYNPDVVKTTAHLYPRKTGGKQIIYYGMQGTILEYLSDPITYDDIKEASEEFEKAGIPFNKKDFETIVDEFDGFFPVQISALDEGSIVPAMVPVATIENTDPRFAWVPMYIEMLLLRGIWYPSTVASSSLYLKGVIAKYLRMTSDIPAEDQILWRLHDFGGRGVSSGESAAIGGSGHLVPFVGSDTMETIQWIKEYYGSRYPLSTIPAGEHSIVMSYGKDNEVKAYENAMIHYLKPGKALALPMDTYDLFRAIQEDLGVKLKDRVINSGGLLVVRPDSGVPERIVVETLIALYKVFGGVTNSKGKIVLPPYVRAIQGDGININSVEKILDAVSKGGFSTENLSFGEGSGMLQEVTRDAFGWVMKPSEQTLKDGTTMSVFKDPITDPGKSSFRQKMSVVEIDGKLTAIPSKDLGDREDLIQPIYNNGNLLKMTTFEEIRNRVKNKAFF